jgi:hypothetical protein
MKNPAIMMILCYAILTSCYVNATNEVMFEAQNQVVITPTPLPTVSVTPKPKEKFDIHSKIGIVEVRSSGENCLRTKNGHLNEKTPVSVIVLPNEAPQQFFMATVEKKLDESCARRSSENGDKNPGENHYYSLIFSENLPEEFVFELGIGVIEPTKPFKVQNSLASIDLNEYGKREFFRFCQGYEGFHFTIWTGKPLKGKRIWHSFYYVDYDTVVTCKKKDWEKMED